MYTLENNLLRVDISEHGAEVKKIYHKEHELDYLWHGDPAFWGRTSPVLFPIVGALAENTYLHKGKKYQMSQHGFARDHTFQLVSQTDREIWFGLEANEVTKEKYPFDFLLEIGYELLEETLVVKWRVKNQGDETMPFSIGGHPAFSVQLGDGDQLADYSLALKTGEEVTTYIFDNDKGLVRDELVTIPSAGGELALSKELFTQYPTLILENETGLTLKSDKHDRGVTVGFDGFPYVGIWSPINKEGEVAPFVCIEPWFGMADVNEVPGELKDKKGIQLLAPGEVFEASYFVEVD